MSKRAVILSMAVVHSGAGYDEYQRTIERIDKRIEGLERIAADVWLIPLPSGLPALGQLVSVCVFSSYEYKVLHIEHEAVWTHYGNKK